MDIVTAPTDTIRCRHCQTVVRRDDTGVWRDRAATAACADGAGGHQPMAGRHAAEGLAVGTANYRARHEAAGS